jgi:hypothetical protein
MYGIVTKPYNVINVPKLQTSYYLRLSSTTLWRYDNDFSFNLLHENVAGRNKENETQLRKQEETKRYGETKC